MIRRVILLRLEPAHRPGAAALGARILALLRSRPMVAGASVAHADAALRGEGEWDLCVIIDLVDEAALAAYRADEVHAAFVRQVLAPLRGGA
ncbi:MAG: hypothetical protein ABIO70_27620 [Pseudomonadota bacterium]